MMEQLCRLRLACTVIGLFSFPPGFDQTAGTQKTQMMCHGRAAHIHHGRNMNDAFFAMAKNPENTDSGRIADLLENISDGLEMLCVWEGVHKL